MPIISIQNESCWARRRGGEEGGGGEGEIWGGGGKGEGDLNSKELEKKNLMQITSREKIMCNYPSDTGQPCPPQPTRSH